MNYFILTKKKQNLIIVICLILFVLSYVLFLEKLIPNFFLCDDNATAFLPFYVYNWNSVINNFSIPFINFHQYLGHTYFSQGQTGVLYPPIYLAVFLSKLITGTHYSTIDILVFIHFSCSAVAMFFLLKHLKIKAILSFLFSLIWITYPFFTITSKSWVFVSYVTAFLPLCFLLFDKIVKIPSYKNAFLLGAVQALFLYQGYIQYVLLLLFFEFLYLLIYQLSQSKISFHDFKKFVKNILINSDNYSINLIKSYVFSKISFFCLSAPLILPMLYQQQESFYRSSRLPFQDFINHALDISIFLKTQFYIFTNNVVFGASSEIFFIGIVNLFLLFLIIKKINRSNKKIIALLILSLISLMFSTKFQYVFYEVPFFNLFRWPFKYFFFFLFFSTLTIALISSKTLKAKNSFINTAIYLGLISTVVFNCYLVINKPNNSISPYRLKKTNLEYLDKYIDKDEGRIFTFGLQNTKKGDLYKYFTFNFATLYDKFHFTGYDPLRSVLNARLAFGDNHTSSFNGTIDNRLLDYLSNWSVRYLITKDGKSSDHLSQFKQLKMVYKGNDTRLYKNLHAFPLVHYYDEDINVFRKVLSEKIDFQFKVNEIIINPKNIEPRKIIVSVAPLELYKITIDGANKGFVKKTDIPLIIKIPPNTKKITIKYVDYYFYSGLTIFILFSLILIFFISKNKYYFSR